MDCSFFCVKVFDSLPERLVKTTENLAEFNNEISLRPIENLAYSMLSILCSYSLKDLCGNCHALS